MVQAFLLVLLFSYQKIITGAFTLVQCVDILGKRVLYIQGDIECYSWWQTLAEVYIVLNIIPLVFVLSIAPLFVEDNRMSVRVFILACIMPVPVVTFFFLNMFKSLICCQTENVVDQVEIPECSVGIATPENTNQKSSVSPYTGPENIVLNFVDESDSSDAIQPVGEPSEKIETDTELTSSTEKKRQSQTSAEECLSENPTSVVECRFFLEARLLFVILCWSTTDLSSGVDFSSHGWESTSCTELFLLPATLTSLNLSQDCGWWLGFLLPLPWETCS